MWESLTDAEIAKYSGPVVDQDGLQPLQDWLVSIANDQIACIDEREQDSDANGSYVTSFQRDVVSLVSPAYTVIIDGSIETLKNGYIDLGAHCIHVFATLIFIVDFRSILSEFFTGAWYSQKRIGQIVNTFQDYLADYEPVLHPSLRDILVEELADELLVHYLSAVRNKGARFRRADPFTEKIKDDVVTAFEFFQAYPSFQDIKQKWRVVDGFVKLIEADKNQVANVYAEFKERYWDVQIGWVEAVLRSRDDFERAMLNQVKSKAAEVYVERGAETIMGKVK